MWLPTDKLETIKVALPDATAAVPSAVPPSLKVTVPVAATGVIEAVKVIDCPDDEGFRDDVKLTVVEAI